MHPLRSRPSPLPSLCLLLASLLPAVAAAAPDEPRLILLDDHLGEVDGLTVGDSLVVTLEGLSPGAPYELRWTDGFGDLHGYVRAAADDEGHLGPEIVWYQSGITGEDPAGDGRGGPGFADLEEAEHRILATSWWLVLRRVAPGSDLALDVVARWPVPVRRSLDPRFSVCDRQGRHRTSFEVGREPVFLRTTGVEPGTRLEVLVVSDRSSWRIGDPLADVSGAGRRRRVEAMVRADGFLGPIWAPSLQRPGRFDVVLRPAGRLEARLAPGDVVLNGLDAALTIRPAVSPLTSASRQLPLSGRVLSEYPHFEHRGVFLRGGAISVAADPTDLRGASPEEAAVFRWAAVHVVRDRTASEWASDPVLADVTEVVEVRPVKVGTLEVNVGPAWQDPDPAERGPSRYDVVIDLGSRPFSGPPQFDGLYTPGLDLIDGADGEGFRLVDDPSQPGPHAVGRTAYDFPDVEKLDYGAFADGNVDIRAVVAYPAAQAGVDVPLPPGGERFPLVVILHGNHAICNVSACRSACAPADRIPNHEGYDYLLDLWASHGFIAVSIDGFDVTCKFNRYLERGALILEHLSRWRKWNLPFFMDATFQGRFRQRVAMGNIAVVGHSRGGEGAVAAQIINQNVGLGWNIRCLAAIAPTDQNSTTPPGGGPRSFVVGETPFFNMMGASDGDVTNMQGARLFDRAAPSGREADKSQVFIYGANHNSWNTVWIDPTWNFGGDDGLGPDRISAEAQQLAAQVYITAWLKAWCQGELEMLAFHQNRLEVPALESVDRYWSYESADHLNVDDFQDLPLDPATNSLGGAVTAVPMPDELWELPFRPGTYDGSFYHDTIGLVVGWRQTTEYVSEVPAALQDVTAYSHLALRVSLIHDQDRNPVGEAGRFEINLEDAAGRRQAVDIGSEAFDPIPYPYPHPSTGRKTMLSSVRIPIRSWLQDGSEVDPTAIRKIVIRLPDTGVFAIDDIQFTR